MKLLTKSVFDLQSSNATHVTCNVCYVATNIPKQLFIRIHTGAGISAVPTGERVGLNNSIK